MLATHSKRMPSAPTLRSAHIPAPVGGLNTVDPAGELPELDCLRLFNLTAAELGLRTRTGYQEYAIGLTGATVNSVRTTLPFTGSHKSGSTNKLFACTQSGIWDVSTSGAVTTAWAGTTAYALDAYVTNGGNTYSCQTAGTSAGAGGPTGTGTAIVDGTCTWNYVATNTAPTLLVTFGTQTGDAGYGVSTVMATPAGRFLLYCDEENGLYIWSESGASWTKPSATATVLYSTSATYAVGNQVVNGANVYIVASITTGIPAGPGPTGTGTGIVDGGVTWNYVSAKSTTSIGMSLADQQAGFSGVPANFAAVSVWKNRVWLVEKDSSRAWYLATNAVYGTATSFDFGSKMRAGGPLANLYNWSYDAGSGLDTLLVGISGAGDVVIYQGTDPTSATTFGLKGTWSVGGVPYGRRIATDYGGEVLILSTIGVVELSRLVVGQPVVAGDRSLYSTAKIANDFNQVASAYQSNQGWAIGLHPQDNALFVLVPTVNDTAASPYVMSLSKLSWSKYRDLPIQSMAVWNGQFYFGTPDGRVCSGTGYVDNVLLSNSNSFSTISWSLVTAYRNGGTQNQKLVKMLRPSLESQQPTPTVTAQANYGYDLSEAPAPTGAGIGAAGTWDVAVWDTDLWGGDYSSYQPMLGASGMGREVAIAVRGVAASRTSFVGVDVYWEEGGLL